MFYKKNKFYFKLNKENMSILDICWRQTLILQITFDLQMMTHVVSIRM